MEVGVQTGRLLLRVPKLDRKKAKELQAVGGGAEELAAGGERCKRQPVSRNKVEPLGSMLPLPLQFLAAWLAVWFARALQRQVDYLMAENKILKEKLGDRRPEVPQGRAGQRPWAVPTDPVAPRAPPRALRSLPVVVAPPGGTQTDHRRRHCCSFSLGWWRSRSVRKAVAEILP